MTPLIRAGLVDEVRAVPGAEHQPLNDLERETLSVLRLAGSPLSARELAVQANRSRQSLLRALRRLMDLGLVSAVGEVRDRRRKYFARSDA